MKRRDAYIDNSTVIQHFLAKCPSFFDNTGDIVLLHWCALYSCGLCHLVSSNKAISFVQERKLANCGRWKNHHHIFTKFSLFPTYPRTLSDRATHTKQSGEPSETGVRGPIASQILTNNRLVHVLWYNIWGRYLGMILRCFGMKIYYDFLLRKKNCFGPIISLFT